MNSRHNPARRNDYPSDNWSDDDGHALQDRLNRKSHRAPLFGKSIADNCEDRRRGHALPSHHKREPNESKRPGRSQQINQIPNTGEGKKYEERTSPSKSIGNPTAGILI